MKPKLLHAILALSLLTQPLSAVDVLRTSAAQDQPQITTISPTGAWATGNTAWIERNNKRLTVTMDSTASRKAAVVLLQKAIEASAAGSDTDPNDADGVTGTWDHGGLEYGEYYEIDAAADYSDPNAPVLTLTSATMTIDNTQTNGIPFVVTAGDTATGSIGTPTNTQAAGGRFHFGGANNWVDPNGTARIPLEDETAVLADSSQSIYFGLGAIPNDLDFNKKNSFKGNVGLTKINTWTSSKPFVEDRTTKITATRNDATSLTYTLGELNSPMPAEGHFYLSLTNATFSTVRVYDAPKLSSTTGYAIQLSGGEDVRLEVFRGSVSAGTDVSEPVVELGSLITAYQTDALEDVQVLIGENTKTDGSGSSATQGGGTVNFFPNGDGGTFDSYEVTAGVMNYQCLENVTEITVHDGAKMFFIGGLGTISTVDVLSGGYLDCRNTVFTANVNKVIRRRGSEIWDPDNRLNPTTGWNFPDTYPGDPANKGKLPIQQNWDNTDL